MKAICAISFIVFLLFLAGLAWANNDAQAPFIVLVIVFGALGGLIRELFQVQKLREAGAVPGWMAFLLIGPVLGAMLAILFSALLMSGLLGGDIFPEILGAEVDFEGPRSAFREGATLATIQDFYKMILWSLVAGFSERFVINKIEQIIK